MFQSHVHINSTLINLTTAMGMAERIKSTVFPITYRAFLHLMIYLFVITLSISLGVINPIYEIPLLLIIFFPDFLYWKRQPDFLQDPFENEPTDTAMTTIATNIEINVKQLLKAFPEIPKPLKPDGFYSL